MDEKKNIKIFGPRKKEPISAQTWERNNETRITTIGLPLTLPMCIACLLHFPAVFWSTAFWVACSCGMPNEQQEKERERKRKGSEMKETKKDRRKKQLAEYFAKLCICPRPCSALNP